MIILTSYGFVSPIVSDKLRKYVKCEDKKILIIPFAGFNREATAMREMQKGLIPFGFPEENIYVCRRENFRDVKNIKFDYIYVPGGNPFKLIKEAAELGIGDWIREQVMDGVTYIGVSAGADYCSENLSYLKLVEDDDFNLQFFEGLNFIKENVICHVEQRDMATLQRVKNYCPEKKLLMLRNDDVYVVNL